MEETCEQGGSAAPRAMLIQLGFADTYNIEVRAGLALLLDPPTPLLCRDLRHEREKCSVTLMLHAVGRDKAQRRRIDRVNEEEPIRRDGQAPGQTINSRTARTDIGD